MNFEQYPLISIDYQLRDAHPFLIEQYLTDGGKDLLNWPPSPLSRSLRSALIKSLSAFPEMQ